MAEMQAQLAEEDPEPQYFTTAELGLQDDVVSMQVPEQVQTAIDAIRNAKADEYILYQTMDLSSLRAMPEPKVVAAAVLSWQDSTQFDTKNEHLYEHGISFQGELNALIDGLERA